MRGKSVLLLVIALVCGAIASVGLTQMLNKPTVETQQVPMMKVFVALDDIDINEELTTDNIKLEEWPKDRVPEGAITKLTTAEGKFAMHRLFKGEPLLLKKIAGKRIGNEEKIPEGYRAVAVRTSAQSAVSNLLLPGTRVDVIWFVKGGSDVGQTKTLTILKDIRVFSVNSTTTRDSEGKTKASIDAKTVTLLVEPADVQKLMLAVQEGTIQFAMRKPDDTVEIDTGATTLRDMLGETDGERSAGENNFPSVPTTEPDNFLAFVNKVATQQPPLAVASLTPTDTMVVMSPNSPPKKFQWTEGSELPQEVGTSAPPAGFSPLPPGTGLPPSFGPQDKQPAEQSPKDSSQGEQNAEGDDRGE
jgi:pilus assembly protein CpaB